MLCNDRKEEQTMEDELELALKQMKEWHVWINRKKNTTKTQCSNDTRTKIPQQWSVRIPTYDSAIP